MAYAAASTAANDTVNGGTDPAVGREAKKPLTGPTDPRIVGVAGALATTDFV
jgi:hypothetical protein